MNTSSGKTALITGASSGIGYELTRCFAQDGHNVVMVANHEDKLQQAAQQIRTEFPLVTIQTVSVDLSRDGAADRLYSEVQDKGFQVDFLVNNAGFGEKGPFLENELDKELALIHLNVITLVTLTKRYLREMVSRGSGKILQVSSVAAFLPHPLLAVYAATKSFVLSFSESLQNEIKDTPVTITVLCPPPTETNFFEVANMENSKIANSSQVQAADEVAKAGYEGLLKGDARVLPTFVAKMYAAQGITLPDSVNAAIVHKQLEDVKK
ncbi:short-chain dehydrogenase [Adhaeribacter aerolatus]|uniref:Short-chain dehydrogenase n=1 Tax=Adhaeribacter aerolatus TaxID=670289 RepID=A0A512B3J9_9BACT|nr:SDR family oxidoreductase [Adhaeribacter aerolatus]GEO06540.1 short-chain dehydrogenase [Adhaeribacter aerolatus]